MKALIFNQSLRMAEIPKPEPGENEALIRVRKAGICNTDIEIMRGYMGFSGVLGHEFVGEVTACHDKSWVGKRVTGEINLGCGHCVYCRQGLDRHCRDRGVLGIVNKNGAFAEYLTLPVRNLVAIPDSVTDYEAVLIEPLAAACEILEQVHILPDHRIAIVGDGKLAQLIVRVLLSTGCRMTVFGKHAGKLTRIRLPGIDTKISETIPDNQSHLYDIVVEASGSPTGIVTAMALIKPRGIIVMKSTTRNPATLNLSEVVVNEITIIGSRCGLFAPALRLIERKQIDLTSLVTAEYPFPEWKTGFEASQKPDALKVVLIME